MTKKVTLLTLTMNDIWYALAIMYRIRKDHTGTTLVCSACPYTERVHEIDRSIGNSRTLAAQAMLKHVHAEHSRESPRMRAMAMVMERQHAPR